MAAKGRRYLDLIAVVAVVIVVAGVIWIVEPKAKQEPSERKAPPMLEPRRPGVKSIAELPSKYPDVDRVILSSANRSLREELPLIEAEALAQVQVRHLKGF